MAAANADESGLKLVSSRYIRSEVVPNLNVSGVRRSAHGGHPSVGVPSAYASLFVLSGIRHFCNLP